MAYAYHSAQDGARYLYEVPLPYVDLPSLSPLISPRSPQVLLPYFASAPLPVALGRSPPPAEFRRKPAAPTLPGVPASADASRGSAAFECTEIGIN